MFTATYFYRKEAIYGVHMTRLVIDNLYEYSFLFTPVEVLLTTDITLLISEKFIDFSDVFLIDLLLQYMNPRESKITSLV